MYNNHLKHTVPLNTTSELEIEFQSATNCYICKKLVETDKVSFFHSLSGYDTYLFIY